MPAEAVALRSAAGRVLAADLVAGHAQPPWAASSMDGYALRGPVEPGGSRRVIGQAAAGHPFQGAVARGDAVRILTGAPLPEGADRVVIQEDAARDGDDLRVRVPPAEGENVRPAGGDFAAGHRVAAPVRLDPARVALAAAMGHDVVTVRRRPEVAILMTGDELAWPGSPLGPGAIYASNGFGLAAMVEGMGAVARILPPARDDMEGLGAAMALGSGADLIVTIGGASVGDHDLVAGATGAAGLDLAFHTVRMRPGKPLLAGRLGGRAFVGLPGNPVSAMVCGAVFVAPMIRAMLGLPPGPEIVRRVLSAPLPANGGREHYMRASTAPGGARRRARPAGQQPPDGPGGVGLPGAADARRSAARRGKPGRHAVAAALTRGPR